MRLASHIVAWTLLAVLVGGCRSYGPKFDPRRDHFETTRSDAKPPVGKLEKLDGSSFTPIYSTNQLSPAWLKPPTDLFRLGPGDVVEIEVLGEAGSHATALVGPDGKIYYSLLPGTFVWGLTLSETKAALEKELAKYLRLKPVITVTLGGVGSKKVWILGNVQSPGVYPMTNAMPVLEAISAAGGALEESADLENSFVMRQGELIRLDFARLLRRGDLSQNIYLQPDDFVYVRSKATKTIYVMGAVAQPNAVEFTGQLSMLSAIARSGGTLPFAYRSQVAIVRGSLTRPQIAIVDYAKIIHGKALDIKLEPGDIVYVPYVPWRKLALFGDQVLRQFVNSLAINEGYRAVVRGGTTLSLGVPAIGPGVPIQTNPTIPLPYR